MTIAYTTAPAPGWITRLANALRRAWRVSVHTVRSKWQAI